MIRVKKSTKVPAALQTPEVRAAQTDLEDRYNTDPTACRTPGNRRLYVPATLYNAPAVKQKLIADQKQKCCYCEGYLLHVGYGDVEHYRPKNGFKQSPGQRIEKPGYYWLAYTWDNLLFTCKRCNGGHKGNYFPLANHLTGRAYSHHDGVNQEQPLLLNPVHDDPVQHIRFRRAVAVGKTDRGRETIERCGLNRKEALERRRTHLAHIESHESTARKDIGAMSQEELLREIAACGTVHQLVRRIVQAKNIYSTAALDKGEYAGMVRANFPHLPHR